MFSHIACIIPIFGSLNKKFSHPKTKKQVYWKSEKMCNNEVENFLKIL